MLIHQMHCLRENDDVYVIMDAYGRSPGTVVRHVLADGTKKFRAFGVDFHTLSDAVFEFTKIPWVRLIDLSFDDTSKGIR